MFLERAVIFLTTFFLATLIQRASGYVTDLCDNANVGIIGGHNVSIEDAPYMAALKYYPPCEGIDLFCDATIIHERFLMTTAPCCLTIPDGCTLIASIGSEVHWNVTNNTNIIMETEKFIPHEHFDSTGKNDICLVKVKTPIPFSKKIAKIDLPDKSFEVKTGTMLNVTGWGMTDYKNVDITLPFYLQQTTIPVVSHECCHEADNTLDDKMICAGSKDHGACYGDAGGPLSYNNIQVGIVSRLILNHTIPPVCGWKMDIYTRVASFLDWINQTITNNL